MLFPLRIATDTAPIRSALGTFSDVLQRFQKEWTPKGTVAFTTKEIAMQHIKIDSDVYPDEIEDTWLGFLANEELDRKTWPLVKWWLEGLLEKGAENLEKNEIFWGVPGTITPGTPTASGTNILGIRKQINTAITAGDIVASIVGAAPSDPVLFVTYVATFWGTIPEIEQKEIDTIIMSRTLRTRFMKGMDIKYNTQYKQVSDLVSLKYHPVTISGVASFEGSTKMVATPKWNRQRIVKKPNNQNIMLVTSLHRLVSATTDYYKGFGFWVDQYVHTNDVDLV